ncbi:MAG: protein-export chaperone SecB [Methylococcales bacterium]|nr:protein-export chaperone SecB [Methylococcales bacterium]
MNIRLINSIVDELSLSKADEPLGEMEFSMVTAFSKDSLNSFLIIFDLKVQVGKDRILTIKYISEFEADQNISENDRESHFFYINAPAISFPFLRAYIGNLTLSSGFDPIILPAINFVKLAEGTKSQIET